MSINEILMLLGGIGGTLGIKQFYPIITNWVKNKSDENKLKIKLSNIGSGELVDVLKTEIQELKIQNKLQLNKIIELEVTLATLRERYADKALHSRGKK